MGKYRVLTPVKTSDGIIHKANETIDLTDKEAAGCLSFKAVTPIPVTAQSVQPAQSVVPPITQQKTDTQSQPATSPAKETASAEDTVVPPESDVR